MNGRQATRIVRRLERKGWSVAEVAVRVRCTVSTIYGWAKHPKRKLTLALSENLRDAWEDVRDGKE